MEDIVASLSPIVLERLGDGWFYLFYGVLLLVLLTSAIAKLEVGRAFGTRQRKESLQLARFDDALARPGLLDEATKNTVLDARNTLLFKSATGIYAERRMRTALCVLHGQLSGEITWRHIARAINFIRLDNATALLRPLSVRDSLYYYANWCAFLFVFLVGFVEFFFGLFGVVRQLNGALFMFLQGMMFLVFAMLPLWECRPYYSARLISNSIVKRAPSVTDPANRNGQPSSPQEVCSGEEIAVVGVKAGL
ncbi:MAG: hypothetical protein R3292_01730 [Alcanivorax sp.]|nr:hypothetical protein [Alcanivorax sp.]